MAQSEKFLHFCSSAHFQVVKNGFKIYRHFNLCLLEGVLRFSVVCELVEFGQELVGIGTFKEVDEICLLEKCGALFVGIPLSVWSFLF